MVVDRGQGAIDSPSPLSPTRRRMAAVASTLCAIGGWLVVFPPGVLVLSLRTKELAGDASLTAYSVIAGLGWLALILLLVAAGRLSDEALRRTGSRRAILTWAIPMTLLGGAALWWAPSVALLGCAWVVVQAPAAALIATGLASAGDHAGSRRRGVVSGLVGAAPLLAVIVGSVVVRLADQPNVALLACAGLGALAALPLALLRLPSTRQCDDPSHPIAWSRAWTLFLVSDLLLSMATATANGYQVPYLGSVVGVADERITDIATTVALSAALTAALSSLASGALCTSRGRTRGVFAAGCAGVAVALAVICISPTVPVVVTAAVLLGLGFGAVNGSELALVLYLRGDRSLGRDLGVLSAATSIPYVLVPALAPIALAMGDRQGLAAMFIIAAVLAASGSVVMAIGRPRERSA